MKPRDFELTFPFLAHKTAPSWPHTSTLRAWAASWPHTSTCLDPNHAPDGRDRSRAWAADGLFALPLFSFTRLLRRSL